MAPPQSGGSSRRSLRDWLQIFGPAILIGLVALFIAIQFVEPAPPRTIRLAAGRPGGAYHTFAARFRAALVDSGITVEPVESAGSLDNIARLRRGEVDMAFVQGGTRSKDVADPFVAVASLYYEPLWVFHRPPLQLLRDLRGKRVAIGPTGSGTRAVALELLHENGVPTDVAAVAPLGGMAAAEALIAGQVEAVFMVGATTDRAIARLLRAEGVKLLDFRRAEAYSRRHRFLSTVTLPRGAVDPGLDLPPSTVQLVAPTAQLVAAADFHPALVHLMLDAAARLFTDGDLTQATREFPSAKFVDYPLSPIAARYFRSGRPFLYRYLPFLVAAFLDRIKVLLLPLLTLIFPLVKLVPPVYRWRVRSRIYRWYRDLLRIEADAVESGDAMAELDRLEQDVAGLSVPPSYADELYHLKHHIELVRARLVDATT